MRIQTRSGDFATIRTRRWALAGLTSSTTYSNSGAQIQLASSPMEPQNFAKYADVYASNPWLYASVQAISWSISRLPLKLYQRQADGSATVVRPAPNGAIGRPTLEQELAALLEMPEQGVSLQEWMRKLVVDRMVFGNSLFVAEAGPTYVPKQLSHVPWRYVEVETGEVVPIKLYRATGGYNRITWQPDEVMHFGRSGSLDGPLGLSPIKPLHNTIRLFDALTRHMTSYYQNSARPSGIIKVDPGVKKEQLDRLQTMIEQLYTSPDNAGRVLVTAGEWQSMQQDPQAAEIVNLVKLSREEIAAVYQVPPPVLGILERAIQSNVVELRSQFLRDVCGPIAASIEGDINAQLIGVRPALRSRGLFVGFDMAAALRPDLGELATVLEKTRHVLTPTEQRDMLGYEPLIGNPAVEKYMSTVWFPSGQVPVGLPQPQVEGAFDQLATMPSPHPAGTPAPQPASTSEQAPWDAS